MYGFNGQEKVDEVSGSGNHYTAEYWEYDPRLGRRWNLDPVDQVSISNYAAFANNPIFKTDPLGNKPGDYYNRSGKWLGSDGKAYDKTYVVSGDQSQFNINDFKTGGAYDNNISGFNTAHSSTSVQTETCWEEDFTKEITTTTVMTTHTVHIEELGITHSQFQKLAGLASKEDFSSSEAIYATANAQANRLEKFMGTGKSFNWSFNSFNSANAIGYEEGLHGFMLENRPKYAKYWNTSPTLRNENATMVTAQAAVVNAWSIHGADNTNGATSWDGVDWQLSNWPAYQRMYGSGFIWDANAIIGKGAKYNSTDQPSTLVNGKYQYVITAAYGSSIYWRPK